MNAQLRTPAQPSAKATRRSGFIVAGAALAGLLLVLTVAVAGTWLWLGTQHSATTVASWINRWVPGVQLSGVTGSVRGTVHIDTLKWQDANKLPKQQATAKGVTWRWDLKASPTQVWQHWVRGDTNASTNYPALTITLAIDGMALVLTPQPETDTAPLALPGELALPVGVDFGLSIAQTTVELGVDTQTVSNIEARYKYAGGQAAHQLTINTLQWQALNASAQFSVNTFGSWPLNGQVSLSTQAAALAQQLAGDLQRAPQNLAAKVLVQGNLVATSDNNTTPPSIEFNASAFANKRQLLSATATIHPFEAQPVHAVDAKLNQLNLSAWLPADSGVPTTSISGSASIAPYGQDPAQAQWRGHIALTQPVSADLPGGDVKAHFTLDNEHVTISQLELSIAQANQAKAWLKGEASLQLLTGQLRARLQGDAPGLTLQTDISASTHTSLQQLPVGHVTLNVSDAATFTRWLQHLARLKQAPNGYDINPQGAVSLTAHFSKGGQVDVRLSATELAATVNKQRVQLHKAALHVANTWEQLQVAFDLDASAPGLANALSAQLKTQLSINPARLSDLAWRDLSWHLALVDNNKRAWHLATSTPWRGTYAKGLASGNASGMQAGPQSCVANKCLAQLNWQAWTASNKAINIAGTLSNLQATVLNTLTPQAAPGWRSNLVLGGTWRARMGPGVKPDVQLQLARTSGDLEVGITTNQWQAVGLEDLAIEALWRDQAFDAKASVVSRLLGTLKATMHTQLTANGWGVLDTPDAALSGGLQLKLDDLSRMSPWLPPTLQVSGRLQTDLKIGGTHSQPLPTGFISASGLRVRHKYGDFDIGGGELAARLSDGGLDIERLYVHGVGDATQGGYASASGRLSWGASSATQNSTATQGQLKLKLVGFQAASKADRRIRISGDLLSQWRDQRLSVSGDLRIDKADIVLSKFGAPSLGDDVVVVGTAAPAPPQALPLDLDIDLSLGDAFKVAGFGLTTGLSGRLHISGPDAYNQPILNGEVTTVDARYKAYGQDLMVKRGRLLFAGRPDAPQLDILAIRALTEPQVGVQVQGPLSAPKVELYANVAMADSEKLSWLLLGHPSARGGSEAALIQNAVLALVGDTNALVGGVDEFSIEGETKLSDGSTRAAQLTVGKQLGERLYTSYTRSVASVQGMLSVYLKLTNSLALRAQTGEANNVDLVWTRAYD